MSDPTNTHDNTIFISYSHADEAWKNEIQKHLSVLQVHGNLSIWDDRQIQTGDEWLSAIEAAINQARVAILLVSVDFLNSKFIKGEEIPRFLELRKARGLKIVPIILKPCAWKHVDWLASLQGAVRDNKPLASYTMGSYECDEVINSIVDKVVALLKDSKTQETSIPAPTMAKSFSKAELKKQIEQPLMDAWREHANFDAPFQPIVFPYETEPEWGEDQYGLWQALKVKDVTQVFRWIPAGTFWMGSPEYENGRFENEDYHQVTLSRGFWLGETPVTQAFYDAVTGKNPSFFKGEQLPVEQVSWEDAQVFISRLNGLYPKLSARLPYEGEWEYACRAGTKAPFHFGQVISVDLVNYRGTWDDYKSWQEGAKQVTTMVKSYSCNAWGLYDIHGNVWEWCEDVWQVHLDTKAVTDPFEQHVSSQPVSQSRVLRGGSWVSHGRDCRSAIRYHFVASKRSSDNGFRLVLGHI